MERLPRTTADTSASPSAIYHSRCLAPGLVGDLVRACRRRIELTFNLLPRRFQGLAVGVGRHKNSLARDYSHSCKRQIDGRAIPIIELDAAARRHCNRIDRPTRMLSEFHDSKPRNACDFWNISGHRYIVPILESLEHLRKCGRATFVVKAAVVGARAPDGADIKPLGG